jgi:hypothetical protein
MLRIVAPSFEAISGELPLRRRVRLGAVSVSTATPVGAILALSLDGRPLESSKRLIVKAVSRASNTGQRLVLAGPGSPKRYRLESTGSAPIRTFGMASGQPTSVWIGERLILSVGQTDGTWELLMDGRQASFTTDTPGVRARILGRLVTPRASEVVTLQVGPSSRRVAGRSEPK